MVRPPKLAIYTASGRYFFILAKITNNNNNLLTNNKLCVTVYIAYRNADEPDAGLWTDDCGRLSIPTYYEGCLVKIMIQVVLRATCYVIGQFTNHAARRSLPISLILRNSRSEALVMKKEQHL